MLELSELLKINVNELLSGEKIMTESYSRTAEKNLLTVKRELEEQNRLMLKMEYLISFPVIAAGTDYLCAGSRVCGSAGMDESGIDRIRPRL